MYRIKENIMADLNEICKNLVDTVNGALGAAVVDLDSGLLLGVAHNVPYFTQSYLDAVAAAAVDMFRGETVHTVEELLANVRGTGVQHMINEIQMTTDQTYHFMSTVTNKPDTLVVMITNKKTNLGMGWTAVRKAVTAAEPLCP
jgi:predicted regulator of Ras-like GTPase activity (Roadblock/LC7/MglB family)